MTKFDLRVELPNDKDCDGCIAFEWDDHFGRYDCNAAGETIVYGMGATTRPTWCPLIPHVEFKIEPSPLTPEELAEYQRELGEHKVRGVCHPILGYEKGK